MSRQYVHATNRNPIDDYQKTVLNVVVLILLRSTSRLSWKRTVTVCYDDSGRYMAKVCVDLCHQCL